MKGDLRLLNIYKTIENHVKPISQYEPGCWISLINPNEQEISYLVEELHIDQDFVRAALDEEESSRIETEEGQTLVIVDAPIAEKQEEGTLLYSTMPFGIIVAEKEKCFITVSLRTNSVVSEISDGLVKNVQTNLKTQFLLIMLLRISARFLQYLKQIDKASSYMEKQLHKSLKNQDLIQLLGLEKSLVYFSTALKANDTTMEKIQRGRIIKLYEEDQDLLDDVLIETKQAIEMCSIYSSILSGTRDAFASIISNNLNIVMKVLTTLTIVMSIPTMVFSFYGMNTNLPYPYFWFPLAIALIASGLVVFVLIKKGMFH